MTERDDDRTPTLETPVVPAAPVVGAPLLTPPLVGDEVSDDLPADERDDHDAIEDDDVLLDPGSPEFDHSLRQRKRD